MYIVNSGGKRIRPSLLLLVARALGYQSDEHVRLAAIVEFIHTATLLHDDVVDASKLRRGRETANQRWGNEASVLVGDFLYSRSFQMMVEVGKMPVMDILAEATNVISEGEVQQLLNAHDPETTEERYMAVIHDKTAKLFEAACRLGAIISGATEEQVAAMTQFGRHIGAAFQLIDDSLDYSASSIQLGKNIGDDLAEGKPTLPLLYAMWHGNSEQKDIIHNAILNGGLENLKEIQKAITSTGAIQYTTKIAQREAQQAIQCLSALPDSEYRHGLATLTIIFC